MRRIALLLYSLGATVSALTGNVTLTLGTVGSGTGASPMFQLLDPNGSNRNVLLPALPGTNSESVGVWYVIRNTGSANNLVIKDSTGVTTYATLTPGDWVWMLSSGSTASWRIVTGSTGLTSLTLSGALTAASASISGALAAAASTFTGRVTTTDGVASGDARVVGGNSHTKQSTTTLTNSNVETTLASHPLPANTIKAGTTVRVTGSARVTNGTGSTTLTAKLKIGSTTVYTLGPIDPAANDTINFDFLITGRAAPGAAAEVAVNGAFIYTVGGADSSKSACLAPANYATNGALTLAFTGQWSASDVNSISCESFTVDVVG